MMTNQSAKESDRSRRYIYIYIYGRRRHSRVDVDMYAQSQSSRELALLLSKKESVVQYEIIFLLDAGMETFRINRIIAHFYTFHDLFYSIQFNCVSLQQYYGILHVLQYAMNSKLFLCRVVRAKERFLVVDGSLKWITEIRAYKFLCADFADFSDPFQ